MEYLRTIQADDDEARQGLRALGALLLGIGALVLAERKSTFADPWGDFALLLVFLIPALLLYGGGFLAAREAVERRFWHGVFLVFGLIFVLFTFFQFIELVDGDVGAQLNLAWTFAVVGALGAVAALVAGVRFGMLAAGLAFIVAWLALWSEILGDDFSGDAGTIRGLSVLAAGILVAAGAALHWLRRGRNLEPPYDDEHVDLPLELLTAGGVAFLIGAGILSATGAIAGGILNAVSPLGADAGGTFAEPSIFWDAVLLVGSLVLIGLGTRFAVRGPAYVGAAGLVIFVFVVGLDLDDSSPEGAIMGWPIVLLLLAVAALVASVLIPARGTGAGVTPPPPSEPEPPPPSPPAPAP